MSEPFKILIFSRTTAYRHESIPAGIRALQKLAASPTSKFTTDASEDPSLFTPSTLSQYRVIVLLQCSGDFLNDEQLAAFKGFVNNGGGVVGIHCTSFAMLDEKEGWYARLIGAAFADHPEPQVGRVRVVDPLHPIIAGSLGKGSGMQRLKGGDAAEKGVTSACECEWEWTWRDEWYNFREQPGTLRKVGESSFHVLLVVDDKSFEGGKHGDDHPIAWCQEFVKGGRSFYTALGHFDEAYEDEGFMAQVLGGIMWTAKAEGYR